MTVPNTFADSEPLPSAPTKPGWRSRLLRELMVAGPIGLACVLLGLLMGAIWYWLAPEVPLVVHGNQVLYVDPEGEQSAGAVGTFVLVGIAFGIVTSVGAFLATRRRGGGIGVAVALGLGGVLGSLVGSLLGEAVGPSSDIVKHAKQIGDGHTFYENLTLPAHGALLAWPITAMVVLLALTATFGKREQPSAAVWDGTKWVPAGADGNPWAPPVAPGEPGAPGVPVDPWAPPVEPGPAAPASAAGPAAAPAPSDDAPSDAPPGASSGAPSGDEASKGSQRPTP
ncbi:ABC transporter permease [Kitasatospora sp. NPDC006697]|uniref:ABC transporter permease n=1 Tax=Kitasatospora sp. NPDC006697 TaxID=3364020 RepID=UPI0036AC35E3